MDRAGEYRIFLNPRFFENGVGAGIIIKEKFHFGTLPVSIHFAAPSPLPPSPSFPPPPKEQAEFEHYERGENFFAHKSFF